MATQKVAPSQLSFITLCIFFEDVSGAKGAKRIQALQRFMRNNLVRPSNDLFSVLRLILPQLDNKRGNYLLKETSLSKALCLACGFDPKTNGQAAMRYKEGRNAGYFAKTMHAELFTKVCSVQDGPDLDGKPAVSEAERRLKVADLNKTLDELTKPDNKKSPILRELVTMCSPRMMFWITKIILKDMKLGVSEKTVLREFHKDAMDLHDVCQDLERVCRELQDPSIRAKRRDIEPGKGSIKPQLAEKVFSVEQAFSKMSSPKPGLNKEFRIDIKLDGERIQLHRMGNKFQYWSRNNKEHGAQSWYSVMNAVAALQIIPESCILDGEFIVWNKSRKRFEPFGNLKNVVLGARDARPADHKVNTSEVNTADPDYSEPVLGELCLTYVVFDIMFLEPDGSVIKRSLKERQHILKRAIRRAPPSGHPLNNLWAALVVQAPGETILNHDEPSCRIGHSVADIQTGYEHALSLGEEGVIVKDLHSEWQINDRSGCWVKIKPDHTHAADVDCLIIGAMWGEGRHGGEVSQYLLALAEEPKNGQDNPHTFHSFCKVGSGLTDAQQMQVRERLQPHLMPNTGKNWPKCYKVTGRLQERPDFWVKDPYQSLVLKVTADIRGIQSREFYTYHSLRFPRVVDHGIRWDKGAADVETTEHFNRLLADAKGTFLGQGGTPEDAFAQGNRTSRKRQQKQARKQAASVTVIDHRLHAKLDNVKVECKALEDKTVAVVNYGPDSDKQDLEELVHKLGATMHMNFLEDSKTPTDYLVAGSKEGLYAASFNRYRFAPKTKKPRAILSIGWLRDCYEAKEWVQPRPCHYLNLPKEELAKMPAMGKYGLSRYGNIDATDVACSLNNHADLKDIDVNGIARSAYAKSVLGEVAGQLPVPGTPAGRALRASAEDRVLLLVDTVLQENGLADSSVSLFRACTLCFVDLPKLPSADAPARASPPPASGAYLDAEDAKFDGPPSRAVLQAEAYIRQNTVNLHHLKLNRLKQQVQLAGGHVTERITDATTHVVAVPAPGDVLGEVHPEKLLSAVSEQAGGKSALIIMQRLLREKALDVVRLSWVEAALDDLDIHPVAAMLPQPEAHIVPMVTNEEVTLQGNPDEGTEAREVHTYRVDCWPWGLFGVGEGSAGKRGRSRGSRSRSSTEKAQSGGEGAVDQPPVKKARRKAAPAKNSPLSVGAHIQKSRPAGRGPKRKPIPEDEYNEAEAGPQSRQGKPNTAEAEDWLGPPLIKEEPADPSKHARGGAAARFPTSVAAPMDSEDIGAEAAAPKEAQEESSHAAGAAASRARMGGSTGHDAASSAAANAAAQGARSDGGGAALPAAPGAVGSSGGGRQAAAAAPAKPALNSLLMAVLQGGYGSDASDAEATPTAAQGPPPVPAPVDVVPDSAPVAALESALAVAEPAAADADADAQPTTAPPPHAHLALPRASRRPVNLFKKYGKRQR